MAWHMASELVVALGSLGMLRGIAWLTALFASQRNTARVPRDDPLRTFAHSGS